VVVVLADRTNGRAYATVNLYWIKGALLCFSFWLRVLD